MKDASPPEYIVVRQYGLRAPADWGDDVHEQLFLRNRLWNRLVELERGHREALAAAAGEDFEVAATERELTVAIELRDAAKTERKRLRSAARRKVATPELDATIAEHAATAREVRARLTETRRAWRERSRERLTALAHARFDAVRALRPEFKTAGLWADNHYAVVQAYERARKRPGSLNFHRFDGSGQLTVQVKAGGISPAQLFAGAHSDVQASLEPSSGWSRRAGQRGWLTITVSRKARERRALTFGLIVHRALPEALSIKYVQVQRRRVGTHFDWSVTIQGRVPAPAPEAHPSGQACGIDLGWRKVRAGLRVASVVATDASTPEMLVLPDRLLRRFERVEALQAQLDRRLDQIRHYLASRTLNGAPEVIAERLRIAKTTRIGARRLAQLVLLWRDQFPSYGRRTIRVLEAWRRWDRKRRDAMCYTRLKAVRHRRELYRLFCKRIAERYAVMGIESMDLAEIARLERASGEENALPAPARRQRQLAGIHELRAWLAYKARVAGCEVVWLEGPSTMACRHCGQINRPRDRAALHWRCEGCAAVWDQDVNAAHNLLDAARGEAASAEIVAVE